MTHNACIAYPEWVKDKKIKLPTITDEEINNAEAAAAAMISTDELADNDNE